MDAEYTGETIATMVTVPLLILVSLAVFWFLRKWAANLRAKVASGSGSQMEKKWDIDNARLLMRWSWTGVVLAGLIVVATWWGMYPWHDAYHQWTPVAGTVETVDSRLVSTGDKTMEDKFVVKFQGQDQQYGVLDTRAAGLKPGDHLTITCVRRWQWSGTHGYDCNFVSLERAK